jgi:NAD(P)-dependent dehydrogenase (short-subunit alcohol dehydrogenase family)
MTQLPLKGKLIILTGVGLKPVNFVFKDIVTDAPSHTSVIVDGQEYKANIGAATAYELCQSGAEVHMLARTEKNLRLVSEWIKASIPDAQINFSPLDIKDESKVKDFVAGLPKGKSIYWVQSVGLGGGTVAVKDDNPYLNIEDISAELVEAEMTVLKDTVSFLQKLLPVFKKQKETRIVIVSSMSAVRSVPGGSIHNAAKGAISRFANAAMIELGQDNIFVTDVRPGGVDTGLYDSSAVQKSIVAMATAYGYDWSEKNGGLRLAPPSSVGKLIAAILSSEAHVTSVNLVARGQWPHEGS